MGDSFFTSFLVSNLLLSMILCMVLLFKKIVKGQITVSAQYHISLISLFILMAPFIPFHFLRVHSLSDWIMNLKTKHETFLGVNSTGQPPERIIQNDRWLQDFSITIEQTTFGMIDSIFFVVWLLGMVGIGTFISLSNRRIAKVKQSLQVIEEKELLMLFSTCKEELDFSKRVVLGYSSLIQSPITFGIFKSYIILPKNMSMLSSDEVRCVLLHELYHCKRKDMLVNYFMLLARIVYWFNPIVWYFLRNLKTEMEISCDYAVLKKLEKNAYILYGQVILKFSSLVRRPSSLLATSEISSSYKVVKRRIVSIANFQVESQLLKAKSTLVLMVAVALLLISAPSISVLAVNKDQITFASTNVIDEDYSSYFDELLGAAVLYDSNEEQYHIYNHKESTTRYAPASTYKIYNSLFALESGVITRENSKMNWDGTQYQYEEWNQEHDLFSAMETSASWYFQNLDQQIEKQRLQNYFEQINYGNTAPIGNISDYWVDGTVKIAPVEQVDLLKKFYHNEFAFDQDHIQTIKDTLFLEESNGNRLFGKTGTAVINGEQVDGWFVGYVETTDNTFFFAVHIQGEKEAGGSSASKIALSILEKQGIYETK